MAMPAVIVIGAFLVAVAAALGLMAYLAWRGSQPSDFFMDAVQSTYDLQMPEDLIDQYYDLKEKIMQHNGITIDEVPSGNGEEEAAVGPDGQPPVPSWAMKVSLDERKILKMALMRRLVACIDKLDQVQRDKPGNWKLWRGKLVSERYWSSLCDAERAVSEEIDSCVAEAEELEPGWRQHIFPQAVQFWRIGKQQEMEKDEVKKAVESEKQEKVQEQRRKEEEERKKQEDKVRQEKKAEKLMEQLIREEEKAAAKAKSKSKADAKQKAKKK